MSWRYGDPENHELRGRLSEHLGVTPEQVVVGEGIDGLLGLIVRLIVEPGTPVVTSLGAYPTFNFHVAGFGGRLVTVPYRDGPGGSRGGFSRPSGAKTQAWSICPNPTTTDGHLASGGKHHGLCQGPARDHHAGAGRGLWRKTAPTSAIPPRRRP